MSVGAAEPSPPRPWYREPWPWIIIGLLGSVMVASGVTVWIAVTHPDALVVEEGEYREIRSEMRAQDVPGARDIDTTDDG